MNTTEHNYSEAIFQFKPNKQTQESQERLVKYSVLAKQIRKLILETTGSQLSINECVLEMYREETGERDFKRADQWHLEGYQIKRGEAAFRIWGSSNQDGEKVDFEQVGWPEATTQDKYENWPMCCLFHGGQVEPKTSEAFKDVSGDFKTYFNEGMVCIRFALGKPSDEVVDALNKNGFEYSLERSEWIQKATLSVIKVVNTLVSDLSKLNALYSSGTKR